MRIVSVICFLVFVLNQNFFADTRQDTSPPPPMLREAERLWEQAVAAKGGRERLYSVRNMVVSSTRGKGGKYGSVELFEFPSKYWGWYGDPQPLGQYVRMYNLEDRVQYTGNDIAPDSSTKVHEQHLEGGQITVDDAQLMFLLETKWLKPVLTGVSIDRVGRKRADVVQTLLGERRVDFYLDRESHLPLKMALVDRDDGRAYYSIEFYEYAEMQGIQLPRYIGFRGKGHLPQLFQFNVEYDEQIFKCPPTVAAGPDAWKAKSRQ